MKEYEYRQLTAAGIQIFLRQYRYRLDNINFMDLRYRTKLLNMRDDFYENHIDSIAEDISSEKIDLQSLPYEELFRLFSLCAEIARIYGGGFWADYSHTSVQCHPDIEKLFPWILQNSTNPLDRIWGLIESARRGDENARARLEVLSDEIKKMIEDYVKENIFVGVQWVSDNGTTFALFCYASGNPGLGIIIDKIVLCCDITIIIIDYQKTKDIETLKTNCLRLLTSLILSKFAGDYAKLIMRRLRTDITKRIPEYIDQFIPIMQDFIGTL